MFFWNSLAFFMIQWILAIWSLVPLPFLIQLEHLLKPGLQNFEHYFASMWDECNCVVHSLALLLFEIRIKTWPFPVLWPLLSFPNFLAHWVQHFNIIMLRSLLVIINSYSWSDKEGGNLTSPPKMTKISCQILRLSHSFFWFRTLQCWKQVFQPSLNTGRTIYWNILGSQINTCISMGVIFLTV